MEMHELVDGVEGDLVLYAFVRMRPRTVLPGCDQRGYRRFPRISTVKSLYWGRTLPVLTMT